MQIQLVNRTSPEKVFIIVKNSYSTAVLSNGQVVAMDMVTDIDGIAVTKPTGELRAAIAGVVSGNSSTIAVGAYGLVQCYGYNSEARVSGGSGANTSKATHGRPLFVKTSGFCFHAKASLASAATIPPREMHMRGVVGEPTNTAARSTQVTTAAYKVWLNCM